MSTRLFDKGRQNFADGAIDWNTNTIRAMALDLVGSTDTFVKAITGVTTATPAVVTSTAHGFSNGDVVVIGLVGGTLNANGTFKIANVAANTFELTTLKDGLNVVGTGTYTSGGYAINLTQTATLDQISAGRVADGSGTDPTLTTPTLTNGVLDADDVTFTTQTGTIHALVLYKFVTNDAASLPAVFMDGKQLVTVAADAASSATTLWVEPLAGGIPNGTVLRLSNGVNATLSSAASAGARSLAVSALSASVAAGHQAETATTGSGLPVTVSGTGVTHTFDNGANKIIKI